MSNFNKKKNSNPCLLLRSFDKDLVSILAPQRSTYKTNSSKAKEDSSRNTPKMRLVSMSSANPYENTKENMA